MDGVEVVPEPGRRDAYTLLMDGTEQSHVDLADPTRIVFEYVQRFADVLDATSPQPERRRVVHVGGAAMTFARYVAATRPGSAQVVLEPNVPLTAHVREHLPLPPRSGIKVRATDGRTGLGAMRHDYADVIVLDAFDGPYVPADLTTAEAFATMADVLVDEGLLLVNVADRAPFAYARRVAAGVRESFPHVVAGAAPAVLRGRRYGNVLLAATRTATLPVPELARRAASSVVPYRLLAGDALTGPLGGGTPFTDADSSRSPDPPGGAAYFS